MFRPTQLLGLVLAISLLTGCATRTQADSEADQDATTTLADTKDQSCCDKPEPTRSGYLPDKPAQPAAPSIKAGQSQATASGFVQEDGSLKPDIQAYADEVSRTRNIPQPLVEQLLQSAVYNKQAAKLMSPSKTRVRPSWVTYRKRFVEPIRLKAGKQFWQEHAELLEQVQQEYGVPAAIIVSIIGVETIFGRYTGDFRTLDALATLGFRHPDPARPKRSQMFRDQLADLIELHHRGWLDAHTVTGSYAGAIGLPQFMPGSLRRFAIDGDGDGKIDLEGSVEDAAYSVANYLRHHGWEPDLPVFAPVSIPDPAKQLETKGLEPNLSWRKLHEHGVKTRTDQHNERWQAHRLGMVDLVDEPRDTVEYRVGTPNFFAITHYNHSYFYAASVADLAQQLARQTGQPNMPVDR